MRMTDAGVATRRRASPGNVRGLATTMERLVRFSNTEPARADDLALPAGAPSGGAVSVALSGDVRIDFPDVPPWVLKLINKVFDFLDKLDEAEEKEKTKPKVSTA